jgi:hypothetical protein
MEEIVDAVDEDTENGGTETETENDCWTEVGLDTSFFR